jgi:hypothetical protein
LLHSPQIDSSPPEFMQPEVFLFELCAFGPCFQAVEEIQLADEFSDSSAFLKSFSQT